MQMRTWRIMVFPMRLFILAGHLLRMRTIKKPSSSVAFIAYERRVSKITKSTLSAFKPSSRR
jgi:hypothetical protein